MFLFVVSLWASVAHAQTPPPCGFGITASDVSPCPGVPVTFTPGMAPLANHVFHWAFVNTTPPPTQGPVAPIGATAVVTFPLSTQAETWRTILLAVDTLTGDTLCTTDVLTTVRPGPNPQFSPTVSSIPDGVLLVGDVVKACGLTNDSLRLFVTNGSTPLGSITNYILDWGDGTVENHTNASFPGNLPIEHLYLTLGKFNVTLTATHTSGCSWTSNYTFFNGSNPTVGLGSLGPTVNLCPNDTLPFAITNVSGNAPGTEYTVFLNNVVYATYSQDDIPDTFFLVPTKTSCGEPGNRFVLRIVASNPCDESVATFEPIRVNGIPQALIGIVPPPNSCPGAIYRFLNNSTGSANTALGCNASTNPVWSVSPGVSPTDWQFVNGTNPTSPNPQVQFNTPGVYTIALSVTNGTTCSGTDTTAQIEIQLPPDADADALLIGTDSCASVSYQLRNFSAGVGLMFQWTATLIPSGNPASGVVFTPDSLAAEPVITFNLPGTYNIRLRTWNRCDEAFWDTTVTVYAQPLLSALDLSGLAPFCTGEVLELGTGSVSVLATGGFPADDLTYLWDFGPGAVPSSSTAPVPGSVFWNTPGEKIVTLRVENPCGFALVRDTLLVLETAVADAQWFFQTGACLPAAQVTFANMASGWAVSTAWDIAPISGTGGWTWVVPPNADSLTPVAAFDQPGTYIVTLTASNDCPATSVWTDTIHIYAAPTVVLPADLVVCEDYFLEFDANNTLFNDNGTAFFTPVWTWQGPTPGLSGTHTGLFPPAVFFEQNATGSTYAVTVTVTVENACGTTQNSMLFTNFVQEQPVLTPNGIEVCQTDTAILLVADFLSGTPVAGVWQVDGTPIAGNTVNPLDYLPGPHTVTFVAGTPPCTAESSIGFLIHPLPDVSAGGDIAICREDNVLPLQPSGDFPGTWVNTPLGVALTGNVVDLLASDVAVHALFFQVTNPSTGCTRTDTMQLTIHENTPVALPPDTLYCHFSDPVNLPLMGLPGLTWSGPGVQNNLFFPTDPGVVVDTDGTGASNTLTATVINTFGCVFQAMMTVYVVPPPTAGSVQAGPDRTLCLDDTVVLAGVPVDLGIFSGPGVVSGVFTAAAAGIGQHTITYTFGGSNCSMSANAEYTVLDTALALLSALPVFCANDAPAALPATNPAPVAWSGPGVQNNAQFHPALALSGTHTLTYEHIFSQNGVECPFASTVQVTVNDVPHSAFAVQGLLCEDALLFFENNTPSAVAQTWHFGTLGTSADTNPFWAFGPGDHLVQLMSQTAEGCRDTVTQTLMIRPRPSVALLPDQTEGCGPLTVSFANAVSEADVSYLLVFSGGMLVDSLPGNTGTYTFAPGSEAMTYTLRLVAASPCDTVADEAIVLVKTQPYAGFGISYSSPCSGAELLLNVTSTGGPDSTTVYTSTNISLTADPPNLVSLQFFTDTLLLVGVWAVSENECGADTAYQEITVFPADISALIVLPDTSRLCVGDAITLTSQSTPGAVVHWLDPFGNPALGDHLTVTLTTSDPVTVALYAEGCGYDSITVQLQASPAPVFDVTYPAIVCPGVPVVFEVTSDAGGYTLFFPDSTTSVLKTTTKVFDLSEGTYPVSAVAYSFPDSCSSTWTGTLTVAMPPAPQINVPDTVCAGTPVLLSQATIVPPGASCVWRIGTEMRSGCSISHTFSQAGIFPVVLQVTTAEGCPAFDTAQVYVRQTPVAAFEAVVPQPPCAPVAVQFVNLSTDFTDVYWQFGDGNSADGVPQPGHTYLSDGLFTVRLVAAYQGICFDTTYQEVRLYAKPAVEVLLRDSCTVAAGTTLTVLTSSNNPVVVTGPGYEADGLRHTGLQAGSYNVLIQTPEGCGNDSDVVVLKPIELILKTAQDSFRIRLGESVRFDVQPNLLHVGFAWAPTDGLDNPASNTPTARPTGTTTYIVTATDPRGCTKADTLFVEVLIDRDSLVFIPNAFTPNDDGSNDVFLVRSTNPAVTGLAFFRIFDRWGELVFEAGPDCVPNDPACGWDGDFRGRPAQMGAYRYEVGLRYFGSAKIFDQTGQLLLIR